MLVYSLSSTCLPVQVLHVLHVSHLQQAAVNMQIPTCPDRPGGHEMGTIVEDGIHVGSLQYVATPENVSSCIMSQLSPGQR